MDIPKESSMQVNQNNGCLGVPDGILEKVTFVTHLLCAKQGSKTQQ